MKRYGYLFEKIIDPANIRAAILKAAKGKTKRKEVRRVLENIDSHAAQIGELLTQRRYEPCRVIETLIKEGAGQKERLITKIRFFPDQIIHWCVIMVLQPIIIKSSYALSCGSIPGRGVHLAKEKIEKWIRADKKNTKYVAKLDISKFYSSIPHEAIKSRLRQKIKDKSLLALLDQIIGHWHAARLSDGTKVGLPIGFLTSQWLANFLLEPLDNYIKQRLKIKYYVRYMDDMILMGPNKKYLHAGIRGVGTELLKMSLSLKKNWQVFRLDNRAIDSLGFRFFRAKTTLRKSLMLRISAKCKRVKHKYAPDLSLSESIISYMGWVKHSDSKFFYNNRIKPFVSVKHAKIVISCAAKLKLRGSKMKELTVEGMDRPVEIDDVSSPTTVYVNKDVTEKPTNDDGTFGGYTWRQEQYTREEWALKKASET